MVAVDVNPARLESALAVGAEHAVNPTEQDPVAAIQRLGGADATIVTAVFPTAFEQAFRSLARGGKLVCVGLPAQNEMTLPIFETVLGGLEVAGSIVGTRHDLEEVFELHRRGLTKLEYVERSLEDVNTSITEVLDGTAPAPRLVFRMDRRAPGRRRVGSRGGRRLSNRPGEPAHRRLLAPRQRSSAPDTGRMTTAATTAHASWRAPIASEPKTACMNGA